MLRRSSLPACARAQSGVVLMAALIVLIAMTLAGLALMRSVDTAILIAGNLSFQQSATHSADSGIETGIAWVENNAALLNADSAAAGYAANGLTAAPARTAGQTWDAYWTQWWNGRATVAVTDAAGNSTRYVVDRLCTNAGSPTGGAGCSASPVTTTATGNAEEGGEVQVEAPAQVYYRITARVQGARNTLSYVQAIVAR